VDHRRHVRRGFRLGLTFTLSSRFNVVIAGLVPAISFSWARRCSLSEIIGT
jgi:hypothetical protein